MSGAPVLTEKPLTERQVMLAGRADEQRSRVAGYRVRRWDQRSKRHVVEFLPQPTRMQGVPAWMNRRTGKPHDRKRESSRRAA